MLIQSIFIANYIETAFLYVLVKEILLSKIVIHIGYSKAASTWLQEIFYNCENLSYYHKPTLWRTSEEKVYWDKNGLIRLVKKDIFPNKPLIISHEHLILPGIHPTLICATTNLDYVRQLANFLSNNLKKPRIILIIRRQDSLIASRYHQYIMQGGSLNANSFLAELLPNNNPFKYCDYRFSKVIELLKKVIGEAHMLVATVDDIKISPDKFLKHCSEFVGTNISSCSPKEKSRVNVGLSFFGAQIAHALNTLCVKEKEGINFRTKTRIPYITWLSLIIAIWKLDNKIFKNKKRPPIINSKQRRLIRNIFRSDNLRLSSSFDAAKNWL